MRDGWSITRGLVCIGLFSSVALMNSTSGRASTASEWYRCVQGHLGIRWVVTHRFHGYASIVVDEPRVAERFRGTIQPLSRSPMMLIAAQIWGFILQREGDFRVYAVAHWPSTRPGPDWLLLIQSFDEPNPPGSVIKVTCQR